MIKRILYS